MNYYQLGQKQIQSLNHKASLLLHVCCGACSAYTLEYLSKYFKITILFTNSNIYPYEEFNQRLDALKKHLAFLKDDSIKLIVDKYDYDTYIQNLLPYKDLKEGLKRCQICYELRLRRSFEYAFKNHYEYVGTVMSISSRKNSDWLNEIGTKLAKEYQVKYLYADFKKHDGSLYNNQIVKDLNLYHQNYCGCEFSKN